VGQGRGFGEHEASRDGVAFGGEDEVAGGEKRLL